MIEYDTSQEYYDARVRQGWTTVWVTEGEYDYRGAVAWLKEHAGAMVGSNDLTTGENNGDWDYLFVDDVRRHSFILRNRDTAMMFKLIWA